MSKRRGKRRRGVSNAELKGYLKIVSMTNKAIANDTEYAIRTLIKKFNVPYARAEQAANSVRRDSRVSR